MNEAVAASGISYRVLADPDALADAVAEHWTACAEKAVDDGRDFSVALSGGSTPRVFHARIASELYRNRLDWSRVRIFFGDERAVGPDHEDSNYRLARETLLDLVPIDRAKVHRMEGESDDLPAAAERYANALREHLPANAGGVPVLDLAIQGLGPDGHTASLFPASAALDESRKFVVAHRVPQLSTSRLTLTYPVLNAARSVLFVVAGEGKAEVAAEILSAPPEAAPYPASRVRPSPGDLLWLLDASAAGLLG